MNEDLTACGVSVEVIENAKLCQALNDSVKSVTTENESVQNKVEIDEKRNIHRIAQKYLIDINQVQ